MQSGGDVSPSTKRRNYRNPRMASDVGKACKRCMPWFAPFAAVSLRVFPQWGSRGGGGGGGSPFPTDPSASSAGAPSRAAEDGCYRGEQEQDGGGLPSLGAQMGSEGETVNEGFFTASRGGYQAGFHQPLALPF